MVEKYRLRDPGSILKKRGSIRYWGCNFATCVREGWGCNTNKLQMTQAGTGLGVVDTMLA